MSYIRVLNCCVDDRAVGPMTPMATFDLSTSDVSTVQRETVLHDSVARVAEPSGAFRWVERPNSAERLRLA